MITAVINIGRSIAILTTHIINSYSGTYVYICIRIHVGMRTAVGFIHYIILYRVSCIQYILIIGILGRYAAVESRSG